eukprot:scaffold8111_cov110-Isochrysis_galbana.AAC.7
MTTMSERHFHGSGGVALATPQRTPAAFPKIRSQSLLAQERPGKCQQCQPVRRARPRGATSARAGAQLHLHRALFAAGRADPLRARLRVQIVLHRRQNELSGRHRSFNRVRGILFFFGRPSIDQAPSLHAPLKPNALGRRGILRIN